MGWVCTQMTVRYKSSPFEPDGINNDTRKKL